MEEKLNNYSVIVIDKCLRENFLLIEKIKNLKLSKSQLNKKIDKYKYLINKSENNYNSLSIKTLYYQRLVILFIIIYLFGFIFYIINNYKK